jgi:hypothetical protein
MNPMTEMKHKNVYVALAAAQMEMEPVVKSAVNPAFKGEGKPKGTPYADLADVVVATLPALTKNGIAMYQYLTKIDGDRFMVTALVHGETESRIECPVELILGKMDMQGYKSACTYAKRIGLESVTGVAPEDDDGNAAAKSPVVIDKRLINADQFTELRDLIERTNSDEAKLLGFFKLGSLEEMPVQKFGDALSMLRKKLPAAEPANA